MHRQKHLTARNIDDVLFLISPSPRRVVTGNGRHGKPKMSTHCPIKVFIFGTLQRNNSFDRPPPPIYNNLMLLTKTTPATSFASLFSSTFAFGAANIVREVAASGGSTKDHESIKAARKLRRGKECSPSFQVEKNADEIDNGILKTCPEDKDCIEDITSLLGGRCVASGVSSESIRSLSSHETIKIQASCVYANGTSGVKCVGHNACRGANITTIECGSCIGNSACLNTGADTTVAENSCVGNFACYITGAGTTVAENSCVGNSACEYTGADTTVAENSCVGNSACFRTGANTTVGENSCIGDRACRYTSPDTTIAENSCVGFGACAYSTFVDGVVGNCQW